MQMDRSWKAARAATGTVVALLAAACVPSAATAVSTSVTTQLGGSPFNVVVGDRGQLQGFLAGQPRGVFFPSSQLTGDAGFFLAFPEEASAPDDVRGRVFGFDGWAGPHGPSEYLPQGQSPVTGTGAPDAPLTQETRYAVTDFDDRPVAQVSQVTSYVNGHGRFRVDWIVTNLTGAPLNFRAFAAADFYYDGDDWGNGVFAPGPPRFVGGTNSDTGRTGGLEEVVGGGALPWSAYEALEYGHGEPWVDSTDELRRYVWWVIDNGWDDGVGFGDTVMSGHVDNAGGVEWNQYRTVALAPGQQARFALTVRAAVPATLQLLPDNGGRTPQGSPLTTTVVALDTDGRPFAGKNLHWSIAGANPAQGVALLGADGTAQVVDAAANLGTDTISAFVDLNGNGVADPNEPANQVAVTVADVTPPACTAAIARGRVGGSGRRARAVLATVTCNEVANLSAGGSLTVTLRRAGAPRRRRTSRRRSAARRRALAADVAVAETSARARRRRGVRRVRTIRRSVGLAPATATAAPGVPVTLTLPVPARAAKRYAGKPARLSLRVGATDAAGNAATAAATGTARLLPYRTASRAGRGGRARRRADGRAR